MMTKLKQFFNPIRPNNNSFDSLIGAGTFVSGNISVKGTLRVFGCVEGEFIKSNEFCNDDTLIIAEGSTIKVESVEVPHIIVEGILTVTDLKACHSLKISKTGSINAKSVQVNELEIEKGASISCENFKNGFK